MLSFFFSSSGDHLDLHSFPTRRSSDLQVSGEADDGAQAIKLAAELRPDVAVLDVAMPVLSGLDAAQEIKRVSPKTKVILLTMHAEDHHVLRSLRAGAKGFLLKTHAAED